MRNKQLINRRASHTKIFSPENLRKKIPLTSNAENTVLKTRNDIENIIVKGTDKRLLVITGPCSIHDTVAAMEYAKKLENLQKEVSETILLVMRVYLEKPRTTVGWKGMLNDPNLDDSLDILKGLLKSRQLLVDMNDMGMPVATECLQPAYPTYLAGLISWVAIGARTSESQTHREMASGLSMPVGFKNTCRGGIDEAVNAIKAARLPQRFIGVDQESDVAITDTTGNDTCHLVLRGGKRPNYYIESVEFTQKKLREAELPDRVIIDVSHGNSNKDFRNQPRVFRNIIEQRVNGNIGIVGAMLESNLVEGAQDVKDVSNLVYGQSITDSCISWETTEELIVEADQTLRIV